MRETSPKQLPSPFENDPFWMVMRAFRDIYPEVPLRCQWVDDLNVTRSWLGETWARLLQMFGRAYGAWGCTSWKDGVATVEIDVSCPVGHAVEVFAHELAHAAVGLDAGHGVRWRGAFESIHRRYEELTNQEVWLLD